ncbi:MAG: D-alanyl-alanine synthetase [Alphaproteobacteria bacterium]
MSGSAAKALTKSGADAPRADAAWSLTNRALPPARRIGRLDELDLQVARLIGRARIAVVYGGDKREPGAVIRQGVNARSWKSYRSVANDIAASLERQGARDVCLLPDDMRLGERLRQEGIDLVWLNTGGVQGRNPMTHAAAMLEMMGVPYVGHDPLMMGILDSKYVFKQNLAYLGLPTARFTVWNPAATGTADPRGARRFERAFEGYAGPYVVKPVSGRASLHVHVIDRPRDLPARIAEVFGATENDVLIEAYLPGREFCIAVSGPVVARRDCLDRMDRPFAFSPTERVLGEDEAIFESMDQRPITLDRVRPLDAAREPELVAELKALGCAVYEEMQLESLVRLDVRADGDGRLHVLEANPKPDIAMPRPDTISIVASGLGAEGMGYDDLVRSMLADRIDLLLCKRRGAASALAELIA